MTTAGTSLQVSGEFWPDITRAAAKTILYLALAEPIGLLLRTSNRDVAVRSLYNALYAMKDPALARLQIRTSPLADGDVVICHRKVELNGSAREN